MFTQIEKSAIRQLLQSPQWKIVEQVIEQYIQNLKEQSNLRESEWETARATALEEGQVQGIKSLIQELYKIAQN